MNASQPSVLQQPGTGGAGARARRDESGGADDDDEKPQGGDAKKANGSEFVRKLYTQVLSFSLFVPAELAPDLLLTGTGSWTRGT